MDREVVLRRVLDRLAPGGGIALIGSATIWGAPEAWAQVATTVVQRWLGAERRAGGGAHRDTQASAHRPFEAILAEAGFARIERGEFTVAHRWELDAIIGHLYSTSYCSPALLGERRAAFEDDLRRELAPLATEGTFVQTFAVNYFLGWGIVG